MQSNQNK